MSRTRIIVVAAGTFLMLALANPVSAAGPQIYALDTLNNALIRVDLGLGTATSNPLTSGGSPFTSGQILQSMEFATDGTLYAGFRQASPFTLTTIDPTTAEVTGIVTDFPAIDSAENIAFAPDGTLYATPGHLISEVELGLAPVSLTATGVNFGTDVEAMEIDSDGTFYYTDVIYTNPFTTTLYKRDGLNGTSTVLTSLSGGFYGLTFAADGKLYTASDELGLLYEVDTTTGALTQVFDFSTMGTNVRIGALASIVIPEPSSAVLFALAGLTAVRRRRRATSICVTRTGSRLGCHIPRSMRLH